MDDPNALIEFGGVLLHPANTYVDQVMRRATVPLTVEQAKKEESVRRRSAELKKPF